MVVALDDLPPLLWHTEPGGPAEDVWTGDAPPWCRQLTPARRASRCDDPQYGQRPYVRQLDGEITREMEDELLRVIDSWTHAKPFPHHEPAGPPHMDRGTVPVARPPAEGVYCAQLVAITFRRMGLLRIRSARRTGTTRSKFWSGDRLQLPPHGASLGGELAVTVDLRTSEGDDGETPTVPASSSSSAAGNSSSGRSVLTITSRSSRPASASAAGAASSAMNRPEPINDCCSVFAT